MANRDFETLIRDLQSDQEELRLEALSELGESGDVRAVESLIPLLADESWRVSHGTLQVLNRIGKFAVEPLVGGLSNENLKIRRGVIEVLVTTGDSRAVEPLIASLSDETVRESVVRALGILGDVRAIEPLADALMDEDSGVRKVAAEALGRLGADLAVGPLVNAARDKNSSVRQAAVRSLGQLRDKQFLELFTAALGDQDSGVRRIAAEALGGLRDDRAVVPLIEALVDEDVFWWATCALGRMKGAFAVESLISALRSSDKDTRQSAVWALGEIGDIRSLDSLVDALQDPDSRVRSESATALGKLRDTRAIRALTDVLIEKADRVEQSVIEALGTLILKELRSLSEPKKPTILVIEDDPDWLDIICKTLEDDFAVIRSRCGTEGLKLAFQMRPDLVHLDLYFMEDTDGTDISGYDVALALKSSSATKHIPILVVSGFFTLSAAKDLFRIGISDFLDKGRFGFEQYRSTITDLLEAADAGGETEPLDVQYVGSPHQSEERDQATPISRAQLPLADLSRLTDGIVHDIRSGMGIIRNTVGFLENDLGDTPYKSDILKIAHSLSFCELVLRNLSTLGGQDVFQPRQVDLRATVREVYSMLERKLVDVDLVLDIEPDMPEVLADEGQIKQVFMNLIKNAGEAMPDGGTLTVRTRREGEMLRIEVSDTGCGISPENQARLFNEFFTTKERGYGLGLHIVHTIVERHGGTIEVESQEGHGTTFIIHLPIE